MRKIYIAWIGNQDLKGAEGNDNPGPIAQTLQAMSSRDYRISQIELLYVYNCEADKTKYENYKTWLDERIGISCTLHPFRISPVDYGKTAEAAYSVLKELHKRNSNQEYHFVFHTSPGTPAMQVALMLHGSTRFKGTLVQSDRELGYSEFSLPYRVNFPLEEHVLYTGLLGFPDPDESFKEMLGNCTALKEAQILLTRVAQSPLENISVLITGEPGTGKEIAAHSFHRASPRKGKFVAVNLGAIPDTLFESELFGAVKGAYTGCDKDKRGKFQEADKGTLFLDEIGELPLHLQVKLLRALQEKKVAPVGSDKETEVDVQIVCATNRHLPEMVRTGEFRDDLYYRIATVVVDLPPLRQRGDDVAELIDHFFKMYCDQCNRPEFELSAESKSELLAYMWPGNVRELKSTIARLFLLTPDSNTSVSSEIVRKAIYKMDTSPLAPDKTELTADFSLDEYIKCIDYHFCEKALKATGGVQKKAGEMLGLKPDTFKNRWKAGKKAYEKFERLK